MASSRFSRLGNTAHKLNTCPCTQVHVEWAWFREAVKSIMCAGSISVIIERNGFRTVI